MDTDNTLIIPNSLEDVISEIRQYCAVASVDIVSVEKQFVLLETKWQVKLPNACMAEGISSTGVKEIETVWWRLPTDFPLNAPVPSLRPDFPSNLPHIYPINRGEAIFPCVAELPLVELLHSAGLSALLDATRQWIENAAADELHCPVQGWEPMRKDEDAGVVFVDTHYIRAELERQNHPVRFFKYNFYRVLGANGPIIGNWESPFLGSSNKVYKESFLGVYISSKRQSAPGILLQTSTDFIGDKYQADTVSDLKGLRTFAKELGVLQTLDARIKYILSLLKPKKSIQKQRVPPNEFMVTFAVRRPFKVIGTDDFWELLPYRVCLDTHQPYVLPSNAKVRSAQFVTTSNPRLLQSVSGHQVAKPIPVAFLGCGSLGSKVALHFAKTGCYQFELVDNEYFNSHNNARHGLILDDFESMSDSKVHLLANHISRLNVVAKAINKSILMLDKDAGFTLGSKTQYIIETTASLNVRYHLSHHERRLSGVLIQCVLYAKSSLGVIAIEGSERGVRVDDFSAYLNTLCIDNPNVREALYESAGPTLQHYGEGCGSATTTMSDMQISLLSATISMQIHEHIINPNDDPDGVLKVCSVDPETNDTTWCTYSLPTTLVIPKNRPDDWNIRVLGNVVKKIENTSKSFSELEVGGAIAGYICTLSKTVYVTRLIDAPPESVQSQHEFYLATTGLQSKFDSIHQKTNGQITFLGTWHSHTLAVPPSDQDRQSLRILQSHYDLPITMLTYTGGRIVRV